MILIIAYGNSLRRDDGAGLVLAEVLERVWKDRRLEVHLESVHQLTPELAETIAGEQVSAVVFVDTRVVDPGVDNLKVQTRPLPPPENPSASMGHHVSPEVLMAYARYLYHKTPPAWLVTAPGVDFDHGEGLSQVALHALSGVPDFLRSLPCDWPLGPSRE
ncbi:hypothetical protein [Syntrophobacter fumaroxidans]|uniref:Hydrogenase maturation protease n=1 Tax=Syntrophobacter fumaroxidans (strain DSM 10017 / MPOB) TaxID=335543 RepID=A0LLU3_SYNFM|nr:hypothetical protein [Syntrophobacter fumaroxidans]ABK18395.1 conserved hypothetical protein [Syntrophobacter fumaroxidans MPOB]